MANDLKTRGNAPTIVRKNRGKAPRTLRIEHHILPGNDARDGHGLAFQSACDALIAKAIQRGLERGTLVQHADGTICSRGTS